LRKTGIIDNGTMSDAQKEAAKHKTARISLSDAMGVAPVKTENSPLKTIRIKRPIDIPSPAATLKPAQAPEAQASAEGATENSAAPEAATAAAEPKTTVTQRKTLKISRPGGVVRPAGKFGIKKPSQATTVAPAAPKAPNPPSAGPAENNAAISDIPEIADIPSIPPMPEPAQAVDTTPAWAWILSSLIQFAACLAIATLVGMLYKNTQTMYF
jgi:hypothetical protein